MNITDENYNKISDRVYWLDPNDKDKYDPTIQEGSVRNLGGTKFKILKIQENSDFSLWNGIEKLFKIA